MLTTAAGLLALSGTACDPQADALYRGEPLAHISGRLIDANTRATVSSSKHTIELGLIWVTRGTAELVPLDAALDPGASEFDADVFDLPTKDALLDCDRRGEPSANAGEQAAPESRLAFAWIVAARAGTLSPRRISLAEAIAMHIDGEMLGWVDDRVLAYVAGNVSEGSHAARLLGAPLGRGIHAMAGTRDLHAISTGEEVLIRVGNEKAMWTPFVPPDRCDSESAPVRANQTQFVIVPGEMEDGADGTTGSNVGTTVDPLGRMNSPGGLK